MSTALDHRQMLPADEPPPFPVKRWTREQYHQLADLGCFDDEQVELLEGWIVPKMVHNPIHDCVVSFVEFAFNSKIGAGQFLRIQSSIVTEESEPEPDVAVVRGQRSDYQRRHPTGIDTVLVVEVAESSLRLDRMKAAVYAQAGIQHYLIVDLAGECVEHFAHPEIDSGWYSSRSVIRRGQTLQLDLDGNSLTIAADELLPR